MVAAVSMAAASPIEIFAHPENKNFAMNEPDLPRFQWRALTSVVVAFAFLLLATSGTMLFLSPPGRVANWTNWTILGLRKPEWTGLHIWFSAIFLAGAAAHLLYNLRPMLSYFKDRMTRRVTARREWLVAAGLCAAIAAGTLAKVPPFATLLAWNEELKENWDRPAERAPIPHAELLTLAALAEKGGVDLATATARLKAKGVNGFMAQTIVQQIADRAKISAQQVYDIILTAPKAAGSTHVEGAVGGGLGWKTLAQFCADEGIAVSAAAERLSAKKIAASETLTLREIASAANRKPYELLEIIREPLRP